MEAHFKITSRSQFFIVKELLILTFYAIIFIFIISYFISTNYNIVVPIYISFLIVKEIPCLFIHYQYRKYNKEMELFVNGHSRSISIIYQGVKHSFHFDQIKNIKLALMPTLYRGSDRGINAWELYHYAVLETKDGKQFVITCLLVNNLREYFEDLGLETIKVRKLFPWIRVPSAYQQITNI
jgi:hypothetical protein